jgi:hypothetical protein
METDGQLLASARKKLPFGLRNLAAAGSTGMVFHVEPAVW